MSFHVENTLNSNVHTVIYNDHIFYASGNQVQKSVQQSDPPQKNLGPTEAQAVREFMF